MKFNPTIRSGRNDSRQPYNPSKYRRDHEREHGPAYYSRPRELSEGNHHFKPWRNQIQFSGFNHSDSRPWDNRLGTPRTKRDDERDHLGHNRKREYHERDHGSKRLEQTRPHRNDPYSGYLPPDDRRGHLGHNRKREYPERDHVGHKRKSTSHLEHVDYGGKRRCHEKGNGSDSLKQPLRKLSPSKPKTIPKPTAKGRKPKPGFEPTPTTPNSPNEKTIIFTDGILAFKENLKKAFDETGYIDKGNRVVAVSFYAEKLFDEELTSTQSTIDFSSCSPLAVDNPPLTSGDIEKPQASSSASASSAIDHRTLLPSLNPEQQSPPTSLSSDSTQKSSSPKQRKEYQLVICLGKSSAGYWKVDPTKKDAFIQKVRNAVSIEDQNGRPIVMSTVKLELLDRMANTFNYPYICEMALDYAKNNSVDIKQLSKIKDEVKSKFNTASKSLNTSHNIDAKRYILDFIHLVTGTYGTEIMLPLPITFREIEDLVTSTAQRICGSASIQMTSSEKVNKTADFLWIFAHNPLCAEKNIWYTEQKFDDSSVTQQLRTKNGQLIVAFEPSQDQSHWKPKPACLSCQALGKMRETYIPQQCEVVSPLKLTKSTINPKYSGSKTSEREPHTSTTGANRPLF